MVKIAVIGDSGTAAQLGRILGSRYEVRSFKAGTPRNGYKADLLVLMTLEGYTDDQWASTRDSVVPKVRGLLEQFRKDGAPKVYLSVSSHATGNRGVIETEVIPLFRQAAREAQVPVIEQGDATSLAEAISEVVADPKIEKRDWRLVSADSEQIDEGPARMAIDGKADTYWHTQYDPTTPKHPHQITVDMGKAQRISGFRYLPRQDGGVNGRVKDYAFEISLDGKDWALATQGTLPNTNKPTRIRLAAPVEARYFRFVAKSEQNGGPWTTAAEIDVVRG